MSKKQIGWILIGFSLILLFILVPKNTKTNISTDNRPAFFMVVIWKSGQPNLFVIEELSDQFDTIRPAEYSRSPIITCGSLHELKSYKLVDEKASIEQFSLQLQKLPMSQESPIVAKSISSYILDNQFTVVVECIGPVNYKIAYKISGDKLIPLWYDCPNYRPLTAFSFFIIACFIYGFWLVLVKSKKTSQPFYYSI